MTPEFLARIFEPFERERTSTESQTQGVGLGMSITKKLVDLMNGTIQVFSEPGQGTEFVLLLVEDNELNMEIAQELLCEAGFLIETAQNGQIAFDEDKKKALSCGMNACIAKPVDVKALYEILGNILK